MDFGFSVMRPYLLGLFVLLPAMFLAWRMYQPPLKPSRSRLSLALRLALVTALVLTLAGVRVTTQPHQRAIVAVVDLSASARDSQDAARGTSLSRGSDPARSLHRSAGAEAERDPGEACSCSAPSSDLDRSAQSSAATNATAARDDGHSAAPFVAAINDRRTAGPRLRRQEPHPYGSSRQR